MHKGQKYLEAFYRDMAAVYSITVLNLKIVQIKTGVQIQVNMGETEAMLSKRLLQMCVTIKSTRAAGQRELMHSRTLKLQLIAFMYCDFNFNCCLCDTVCKHHRLLLLCTTDTTVTGYRNHRMKHRGRMEEFTLCIDHRAALNGLEHPSY